ncbi:hypothetical protein RMONA_04890 [Rickettsia monacensis]|uniref:Uncharacterized protein n=2 Tax=spotted fever group TaxID=114277 RepID=A0A8E1BZX1_9RICK|nr:MULTISPECIES: hypothetical protein [spotted fever group]EER21054.1 hypothetical protein REIS_0160 [Rickettsia endosymbiont of Ixodes scapularis]KDO02989.1 hypothetical protein REISMN_04090 [Rickettsia tamurae subsp. buchneri]CDI29516.1 hypothetical protein RMONA_4335 [Rickettsia monacensis IrR/Munich]CEO17358.1 hypothetical protein RMONA_04890 [Rickettsia monacensis]
MNKITYKSLASKLSLVIPNVSNICSSSITTGSNSADFLLKLKFSEVNVSSSKFAALTALNLTPTSLSH